MFPQTQKPPTAEVKNLMRSDTKIPMVRVETDQHTGKEIVIRANLPIGLGWNRDGSVIEWKNIAGWMSEDEYNAAQNSRQAEAKREAALAAKEKK